MPDEQAGTPDVAEVTRHHVDELRSDLQDEFGDRFPSDRIDELMDDSLARLAGQAAVEDFLPVLAYRYARERLMSLSRPADRPAGSWDVVFVSLSGGGRGQLAAGLTAALSGGAVSVHAAGSDAGPGLDPEVALALEEVGVEVAESYARPVSDEVLGAADVIVTMGRSVGSFPLPDGVRRLDWRVGDPRGAELDEVRRVRDDIERRVRALLEELGCPVSELTRGVAQ